MTDVRYPNESAAYRAARNDLLAAETELRAQIERVAVARRALPKGGAVAQDYRFDELRDGAVVAVKLSELFSSGKDTLLVYSFMYGPTMERPCALCTSILDGLNGNGEHIRQQIDFAVVARSPIARITEFAASRNWDQLRLLSSSGNSYNADYYGEVEGAGQMPMANIFVRDDDGIRHHWGSELFFAESDWSGDARHIDLVWPLWNVLDLTPAGRPQEWYPALSYGD